MQMMAYGMVFLVGYPFGFTAADCLMTVVPPLSEEACALQIVNHMPVPLVNLINGRDWQGGPLLDLPESQGVRTPTAREISRNYSFVKPVILSCPHKANVRQNCF